MLVDHDTTGHSSTIVGDHQSVHFRQPINNQTTNVINTTTTTSTTTTTTLSIRFTYVCN